MAALSPFLRSRPPERALHWAARAVGPGASVTSMRRLRGGVASAVHALNVRDRRGRLHRFVLRRYVRAAWLARDPDLAQREARVLELLRSSDVPAPELVAVDPRGEDCDVPAVLMTRLPGRVVFEPQDMESWLRQLAAALPEIHAVPGARGLVQRYRPYYSLEDRPLPAWSRHAASWRKARRLLSEPAPRARASFIHRDYHPGNALWARGRLTGIVDWTNASWGPDEIDVAHCRLNLALLQGTEAAGRFLAAYRAVTGSDYNRYWDLVQVFDTGFAWATQAGVFGGWRDAGVRGLTLRLMRGRLDEFVARAVANAS